VPWSGAFVPVLSPVYRQGEVWAGHAANSAAIKLHVASGMIMLVTALLQLDAPFRRDRTWHRWVGRVYCASGFVAVATLRRLRGTAGAGSDPLGRGDPVLTQHITQHQSAWTNRFALFDSHFSLGAQGIYRRGLAAMAGEHLRRGGLCRGSPGVSRRKRRGGGRRQAVGEVDELRHRPPALHDGIDRPRERAAMAAHRVVGSSGAARYGSEVPGVLRARRGPALGRALGASRLTGEPSAWEIHRGRRDAC